MKDAIQAVIVDPVDGSREDLQRLLSGVNGLWVSDVIPAYTEVEGRVAATSPQLVVIDVDADPVQSVNLIRSIVKSNPGVSVLPASRVRDSSIILRVIRAGAREFLTLPSKGDELAETVDRLFNRKTETGGFSTCRSPQVIAVTGAAGGVGCTTLAVNLATTLARTPQQETVLVDFDLMLGSIDACLDIIPDQTIQGLVQNIDRLDITLLKRSTTRHSSGLFVLPHPAAMEDAAKMDPDALRRVIVLLKSAFPTVVIDTSKGLQASDFVAFELADVILLVLQLDLTCLRNTSRLLQLFQEFEGLSDRVKLIANRVGSNETEISLKKAEETLKMPISWQIPISKKSVHLARAKGVPIDSVAPGGRVHQSILEIAKGLRPPQTADAAKPRRGLFAAFF